MTPGNMMAFKYEKGFPMGQNENIDIVYRPFSNQQFRSLLYWTVFDPDT